MSYKERRTAFNRGTTSTHFTKMQLPNADKSRVDREKITEYLLCKSHPDGVSKATFFAKFGFKVENWEILAKSLRKHGHLCPVGIENRKDALIEMKKGILLNEKDLFVWL